MWFSFNAFSGTSGWFAFQDLGQFKCSQWHRQSNAVSLGTPENSAIQTVIYYYYYYYVSMVTLKKTSETKGITMWPGFSLDNTKHANIFRVNSFFKQETDPKKQKNYKW